jgi:hypothetical protein
MKSTAYGSARTDIVAGAAERSMTPRKWAVALTAVLAVLLLSTVALYLHPEARSTAAGSESKKSVFAGTMALFSRGWSKLQDTGVTLMVGDCCDPNMCSKYALEACDSNKQASSGGGEKHRWKLRDQIKSLSFPNDAGSVSSAGGNGGANAGGFGGGNGGGGGSGSGFGGSHGARLSGVDRRHPGAAEAAAALGLNLVSGGGSSPLRSYYGEKRDQEQEQQEQQQNSGSGGGEGPPPATVGLLTPNRNRHMGALRAAEAFGLHVTNLGGNGAYSNSNSRADVSSDGEAHTEKLLQTTELTDVFSAPLDVFSGALEKAVREGEDGMQAGAADDGKVNSNDMSWPSRSLDSGEVLSSTRYADPPYGTDFNTRAVPTMSGGGVNVVAQKTIPEGAQEWRGSQIDTHASPTMPAYTGGVHVFANEAGTYTNVDTFVRPHYGTNIGMRGRVGRGGNVQFGGNLDVNGHVIERNTAEGPDQVCVPCICGAQMCVVCVCTVLVIEMCV